MFDILDKNKLTKGEVTYLVIKFLRKKCLLEEFCEEYSDYHKRYKPDLKSTIREAVRDCWSIGDFFESCDSAFRWRDTRKGYCFWRNLSGEWKEYTIGKRFIYGL
jgi:hypothetical protein